MSTTGGFFGAIGDRLQEKAKEATANEQKAKDAQAQIYIDSIKSGNLSPEQIDYAQQQLQKIYGKSKPIKEIFSKFGQIVGMVHGKHGQGGQDQGQGAMTPPPSPQASPAGATTTPSSGVTPSPITNQAPGASPTPASAGAMTPPPAPTKPPNSFGSIAAAGFPNQEAIENRKLATQHQNRMEEIAAQSAGKPKHQQKTMAKTTDGQTIPVNYDPNTGGYTDQQGNPVDVASLMTTASAAMLPKLAWTMKDGQITSVMRDPKTNQIIEGTENPDILPPSGYMEHIHEGEFSYVDPNGILHRVPTASSSGVKLPQGSKGASGGGMASSSTRKPQGGGKSPQGGGNGTMSKPPTTEPQATANSSTGPGRTIGPVANKAIQADAIKASNVARPMVNLLEANEEYMKSGNFTPRGDIGVIVAAVRAMNPGSVRLPQKELEMEVKAGSYGDRLKRYYSVASTGLLPTDQRKDLMSIIKRETTKTAENAAANWKEVFGDSQPLPAHLKNFDASSKPKDTDKKPAGKMTAPPKGSPQTADDLFNKYVHGSQ